LEGERVKSCGDTEHRQKGGGTNAAKKKKGFGREKVGVVAKERAVQGESSPWGTPEKDCFWWVSKSLKSRPQQRNAQTCKDVSWQWRKTRTRDIKFN